MGIRTNESLKLRENHCSRKMRVSNLLFLFFMKFVTVRPGNVSFGIARSVEQERPGGCGEVFSAVYNRVTVPDWQ